MSLIRPIAAACSAVFLVLPLLAYPQAIGAAPATKAQANSFFESCLIGKPPFVSNDAIMTLCACYSASVMETLSAEDIANIGSPDSDPLRRKILTDIYAPCVENVIAEILRDECLNDPKVRDLEGRYNTQDICSCAAHQTHLWTEGKGKNLMTEGLQGNPAPEQPLMLILSHPLLVSQKTGNMVACSAVPR
ncbi:MAG: hypothetical protein HYS17_08555 [Micavibrio aeruginosavorus]|uniref:Uncharacterized protein n=1 Tax=Micavibrio aeruginosavorus TaxID=349221 RepID=A0A7T5R133_9BACT|nr:MAG: hypothetical protein HYS17_08555 [Micavibrio aeruginosavorus]